MRAVTILAVAFAVAAVAALVACLMAGCTDFNPSLSTFGPVLALDGGTDDADDVAPVEIDAAGPVVADLGHVGATPDGGPDAGEAPADALDAPDATDGARGPDLTPIPCMGWVSPQLGGCWYVVTQNHTCNEACKAHGGFDATATQHTGSSVMLHFYPKSVAKPGRLSLWYEGVADYGPMGIYRFDGNGAMPDGDEGVIYMSSACSCRN